MHSFSKGDYKQCPQNYPRGFIKWIREDILPRDNVLLYKKGNVKGFCFSCHSHVAATSYADRFSQQKCIATTCPKCGKTVRPVLEGGALWSADYISNVATVQKDARGTVWIRHFRIMRREKFDAEFSLKEICRWAIKDGSVSKWIKEVNERSGWSSMSRCIKWTLDEWMQASNVTEVFDGSYEFYLPQNWKKLLSGTCLRYLDLEEYLNFNNRVAVNYETGSYTTTYKNVIRHMVDWARYPAVEKLWKSGFTTLILQKELGMSKSRSIAWKQNTLEKALGFPLRLYKGERKDFQIWQADIFKRLWKLHKAGNITEPEIHMLYEAANKRPLNIILEIVQLVPAAKALRYLESENHSDLVNPYITYRDYLQDCVKLNLDLSNEQVMFPKKLHKAHQNTIRMIEYEKNEAERAQFDKQVKRLSKLTYKDRDFIIRPAADAAELIAEGKALHHCVGGYASRMAKGETAIFLIRKTSDPGTPFYTLELRGTTVQQCRTANNVSYETCPAVKDFVTKWLSKVVHKGDKKCKKTAA